MKILNNLNEAKNIAIGEQFIFGVYQGQFIEWRKIDDNLAISEKILDCIVFNHESNNLYTESMMRKWCNNMLGKSLGLLEDTIYVFTEEDYQHYFPTEKSRQTKATEWAIMHGVYVGHDGNSPYWTSSPASNGFSAARFVSDSGLFSNNDTRVSHLGVRPVLKI